MLLESVGTSLLVGKVRKGKFSNIANATIEKWYLFVIAFLIEFAAGYLSSKGYTFLKNNILFIVIFEYILLFTTLYFNRKSKGFKLIAIGMLLNFIVIAANGGRMPVASEPFNGPEYAVKYNELHKDEIATHTYVNDNTAIRLLGDIISIKKPYPIPMSISIGDIFMGIGVFIYIQSVMVIRKSGLQIAHPM